MSFPQLEIKIDSITDIEEVKLKNNTQLPKRSLMGTYYQKDDNSLKAAFQVWGDLASNEALKEGNTIHVEFKISSREYEKRFYTDLTITKIL